MTRWSLRDRLHWLKKLDALLANRRDLILETAAREKNCHQFPVLTNEYLVIRGLIKYYLRNAEKILGDENRSRWLSLLWGNKKVVFRKEPLGVIGIISPYNYPFSLPMDASIAALLAGNAVLLKTAKETPETGRLVGELLTESLKTFGAEGIFKLLPNKPGAGDALVRCPIVDKIHFTGSVATGCQILQENAKIRLTPPTLELGGANAAIVLEDADIDKTAEIIVWARFCGLSCNGIKRVFAVAPIYKELCRKIEELVARLQNYEITPVPEKEKPRYVDFLLDYLTRVGCSGKLPNDWRPQVLCIENTDNDFLVLKEETFVPILPIVKVTGEIDAVRWANHSQFGLGASVFTKDKRRFEKIAAQLECGGVFHNDAMTEFAQPQIPFGGRKNSGFGYRHGPEGLLEFVQLKTIVTERWPAPKVQLFPWTTKKVKWLKRLSNFLMKLS